MGKITVVGSSNTDMIMQLENIPISAGWYGVERV